MPGRLAVPGDRRRAAFCAAGQSRLLAGAAARRERGADRANRTARDATAATDSAAGRYVERQLLGVQERATDGKGLAHAVIAVVAHHRMADGGQVDPDLVGAAGLEPAGQHCGGRRILVAAHHLVPGAGRLPVGRDRHLGGVLGRSPDGGVDQPAGRVRMTPHEGAVLPGDGAGPHLAHQRLVRSGRGSRFSLCERSFDDPRFPKYPRVPVLSCPGFERRCDEGPSEPSRD